jgi:hypothetical protein
VLRERLEAGLTSVGIEFCLVQTFDNLLDGLNRAIPSGRNNNQSIFNKKLQGCSRSAGQQKKPELTS